MTAEDWRILVTGWLYQGNLSPCIDLSISIRYRHTQTRYNYDSYLKKSL